MLPSLNVLFSADALAATAADLLVLGVPTGSLPGALAALDGSPGYNGTLATLVREEEFSARAGSSLHVPSLANIAARRLLLVGTGGGSPAELRQALGIAGFQARLRGARSIAIHLHNATPAAGVLRTLIETVAEGNYRFDKYKAEASRKAPLETLTFVGLPAQPAAVELALASIAGQILCRDLVNEPAAEIYPESLAEVARGLAGEHLSVTVIEEKELREKGMGGISAVGQASVKPPRLIHLTWNPPGAKGHLALVGKGVTFDSGGLSLKPNDGMLTMRCDMAGAASVIGVMKAISRIRPDIRVDGIVGAVENMPGGNAYKLGDILKFYNGKRAEIHNTDAEGRLVLADCLAYASELKPQAIVDLATLTGAAVVALGDWYTAMFTRSDDLAAQLTGHAAEAGDGIWRLPLADLYRDKLKSDFADLKNVGGRAGGSITPPCSFRSSSSAIAGRTSTSPARPSWTPPCSTTARAAPGRWYAPSSAGSRPRAAPEPRLIFKISLQ